MVEHHNDNQLSMPLLCMAHRGEAQHFLRQEPFQALPFHFGGLYGHKSAMLLITGEGVLEASRRISAVLGHFRGRLNAVINIGIAGALDKALEVGSIHHIRTAYGEENRKAAFHSYSSYDGRAEIDCISAAARVLDSEYAGYLACFAQLVDREIWACGAAADLFKLPFYGIKLVSDFADGANICLDIQQQASQSSAALYHHYCQAYQEQSQEIPRVGNSLRLPEGFHFTTALQRQYEKRLRQLMKKENCSAEEAMNLLDLDAIRADANAAKQRTRLLISALDQLLNPVENRFSGKLMAVCKSLTDAGCQVKFAPDYEDDSITLTIKIEHRRHLQKLQSALADFDYQAMQKILNGEF